MMNRKLVALGAAVMVGLAGCDPADVTSYNQNPNSPTTAPATALFTSAVRTATDRFLGSDWNERGWEFVAQQFAEVQYPQDDQYVRLVANSTSGLFNAPYYTELEDFQKIINQGQAQNAPGYTGPAEVMRTWTFGELTDVFGDVPYSQALLGDSAGLDTVAITPAYDAQKDIYDSFFSTLANATNLMAGASGSGLSLGGADPIYGGDLGEWQKFSNSLHARYAMRIVNVDPTKADAELKAAFTAPGGTFTSNADNAALQWPGDGVYDNPWSVDLQTRDDNRISDRLMTYLKGWNDPRLTIYAQPATGDTMANGQPCPADGCYAGAPNALSQDEALDWTGVASRMSIRFYPASTSYSSISSSGASYPSYLMTYAELAFIKAEAAERGLGGLTPGQAEGFYEDAIRASMHQWGVNDEAAIDAYLAQPEVAYKGGVEGQKQIATQKWIALYSDGLQAWSSWRRTCQPSNIHVGPATIINQVMRRFEYSITEAATNPVNLKAAIARQGPDDITTRVWWDTNPQAAPTYVDQATCEGQGQA